MCFLSYFSVSWPCPSLWEPGDLWTLAATCWWIPWSDQLAVLVQHSENNYQSNFALIICVALSSWHVTFPWVKTFHPLESHTFCGIGKEGNALKASGCLGRSSYCTLEYGRAQVWIWDSSTLQEMGKYKQTCDDGQDLNCQNSLLIAPSKHCMRTERRREEQKGPASEPCAVGPAATFLLHILTLLGESKQMPL